MLVRNYDYSPFLCETLIWRTAWNGRAVIAASDCMVGALDGINDAGLAVSLSCGGRPDSDVGFGAPMVVRYVLEFCESVAEAAETLRRIPVNMAHNILLADPSGNYATAYTSPNGPTILRRIPATTNHRTVSAGHVTRKPPTRWNASAGSTNCSPTAPSIPRKLSASFSRPRSTRPNTGAVGAPSTPPSTIRARSPPNPSGRTSGGRRPLPRIKKTGTPCRCRGTDLLPTPTPDWQDRHERASLLQRSAHANIDVGRPMRPRYPRAIQPGMPNPRPGPTSHQSQS